LPASSTSPASTLPPTHTKFNRAEYFDQVAERYAERDALIVRHQQVRRSRRELKQRVDDFAAGLLALGLERGERIAMWSPNNAENGSSANCHRESRADPRQYQPRL
jgi:acyl-CoA synthetase (AMP-forming)/AMP-acid ligase II